MYTATDVLSTGSFCLNKTLRNQT